MAGRFIWRFLEYFDISMKRLKLGTVPFLNSKPLLYAIEKGIINNNINIEYYVPSLLSDKLQNKEVDVGLIPVAELLKKQSYKVVPNISISSYGAVDSVIVLSKIDIRDIHSVAIDKRSRSSTALLKVILEKFYSLDPVYHNREIDEGFLADVDGGMLIGNAGLHAKFNPPTGYGVYDLGEIWTNETGLPFVYAVFAYHELDDMNPHFEVLLESKNRGLYLMDKIVEDEYHRLGIDRDICLNYLKYSIKYDLGSNEIKAINRFSQYLLEYDKDIKEPSIFISDSGIGDII